MSNGQNNTTPKDVLTVSHVAHTYHQGTTDLNVLKDVNFSIKEGELVALVGPSGSGKSTLLQLAGLLDHTRKGNVLINGVECANLSDKRKTAIRAKEIGFVYQYHHLLPEFTAQENIMLPQIITGLGKREAMRRSLDLLKMMKLADRAEHRPNQLSGGEQQRVAIARALANGPALLIADEPTGNLDPTTSAHVFGFLQKLVHELGLATLIATHNLDLANKADKCLILQDGMIK